MRGFWHVPDADLTDSIALDLRQQNLSRYRVGPATKMDRSARKSRDLTDQFPKAFPTRSVEEASVFNRPALRREDLWKE